MLPFLVDADGEAGLFVDLLPLLLLLLLFELEPLVDELPLVEVRASFWLVSSCLDADACCELEGGGLEATLDE